ncbi:hydroxymethylpyrimidine/phosphomethylpyrimidine kinase [Krasilnikovia cinnamomea]|uniref:Hydroxymethylpyrimidine/phosphomethylpyrimidine kinase n=1 Tax=Krasilnikovia cinnamomea TaxID=349313 RepID=A0A4Q7ZLY2_9ACTN|nr:bifunctional hydroxymethylpyrimidine kinase/phosphomethylpyrimidine kinase [Krasilnikovia cinnamomea]RZU51982.1 hydroxymethylpyrimidine/phosphomethylpyrimidine kinase [Krasilnikovia cinnamomea]
MTPVVVLTIAGSDSGAGAGIQADLKTFAALGTYGTSVVTAVTAQNTRAVLDVHAVPAAMVDGQLDAVLDDFEVAATKVGMLGTEEAAEAVARRARAGRLPNLVLDPVLTASTGRRLGLVAAVDRLLPYVNVLTPNRAEAAALLGRAALGPDEVAGAAAQLAAAGPGAVVVTGGDAEGGEVADLLWTNGGARTFAGPRVETTNQHGTGCTFSAAVAARLALGDEVGEAVGFAKGYVTRALAGGRDWTVGEGAGPLDHFGWFA